MPIYNVRISSKLPAPPSDALRADLQTNFGGIVGSNGSVGGPHMSVTDVGLVARDESDAIAAGYERLLTIVPDGTDIVSTTIIA